MKHIIFVSGKVDNGLKHSLMTSTLAYSFSSAARTVARATLLATLMLCAVFSGAQGWERVFGGNRDDFGTAVIQTVDRGFLVLGYTQSFPNGQDQDFDIYLIRTDVDGRVLWEKPVDEGFTQRGNAMLEAENGDVLIVGEISFETLNGPFNGYLLKVDSEGEYIWSRSFMGEGLERLKFNDIIPAVDGGYIIVGSVKYEDTTVSDDNLILKVDEQGNEVWRKAFGTERGEEAKAAVVYQGGYLVTGIEDNPVPPPTVQGSDMFLYRLDSEGEETWKQVVSTVPQEMGNDVIATADGNIVVAGSTGDNEDVALWKYDANGNLLWERFHDVNGGSDAANSIIELQDGSLVIAGFADISPSNTDNLIVKFDQNGTPIWENYSGGDLNANVAYDVFPTYDGGYVVAGEVSLILSLGTNVTLTRTDGLGNIYTNYIRGKVFFDEDQGCDLDNGEQPFSNWLVRVTGSEGRSFFGVTDENGNFGIQVDTGAYTVQALPPNSYWENCLPNGVTLSLTEFYDTTQVNFPFRVDEISCPFQEVDISAPFLAPCSEVVYTVNYENTGTDSANDAYIEVRLDDELAFIDASIEGAGEGNLYTFEIGDLPIGGSGSFTITTEMACDGIATGQAGLVRATIFPNKLCGVQDPNWDMASIEVDGACLTDTVAFRIENRGTGNMAAARSYFIVEEDLMFLTRSFDLDSGQDTLIKIPATGATYRLIAEQSEGHPGNSYPTVAVEGCVEDGGTFSTGFVTQFPENDRDPFTSIQVDELVESMGEARLLTQPKGYRDSLVSADTPLDYRFVFRNIGNDTVSTIVIRDTLPAGLDLSAVRPGASSHPYKFELYHTGVVKITFEDINLPQGPSGENPASYGFVEFRVSQQAGNPEGTVIENHAEIIFDYYPPITTNTVRHVVGGADIESFVEVSTGVISPDAPAGMQVRAYPNPFVEFVNIEVEGWPEGRPLEFTLFAADGRLVQVERERTNNFVVQRRNLPSGTYFYSLKSEGKLLGSGTLMVR